VLPRDMSRFALVVLFATGLACTSDAADGTESGDGESIADGGGAANVEDGGTSMTDGTPAADPCGESSAPGRVDFTHDGRDRGAVVHVPTGYAGQAVPLVVNFHGRNSTTSQQSLLSGMNGHADMEGYAVVYPEGVGNTFNAGFCCGEAQTQNVDDVGFAKALVGEVAKSMCIDKSRVYATGLSNGGYMAQRLACEATDVFAGFASVAGLLVSSPCSPSQARPIIHFHGTADNIVPYDGSVYLQSAPDTMDAWALRNGCTTVTSPGHNEGDASCVAYQGCPAGQGVELCTIADGGHTWPGGFAVPGLGKTSTDISANARMWDFFESN